MISIIIAYIVGFIVATIIYTWIYRVQSASWQQEYRRLMGGIMSARRKLSCDRISLASKVLRDTYNGENNHATT
jgi:hypothetical protein